MILVQLQCCIVVSETWKWSHIVSSKQVDQGKHRLFAHIGENKGYHRTTLPGFKSVFFLNASWQP